LVAAAVGAGCGLCGKGFRWLGKCSSVPLAAVDAAAEEVSIGTAAEADSNKIAEVVAATSGLSC